MPDNFHPMPEYPRHFASDNYAGICPEIVESLLAANVDHTASYGADRWTEKATGLIREVFETDCDVHFVFNGSAANSLILASMCDTFGAVVCHDYGHIANDECNAPGFFSHGLSLFPAPGENGKLTPEILQQYSTRRRDVHGAKAMAVSLTNSTEVGTTYSSAEIGAITETARSLILHTHLDGARFSNAVASLGEKPSALSWEAGVNAMCFGGTKNGMAFGEAVVIFNQDLARNFAWRVKQSGQLASKHRFLAAQWIGFLENDIWLKNARHANAMATRLQKGLAAIPQVEMPFPTQANAVFACLPETVVQSLRESGRKFYLEVGPGDCARLMCAWDTTGADIDGLLEQIRTLSTAENYAK